MAVSHKDADQIIRSMDEYSSREAFFDAFRSKIVVAKFAKKGNRAEADINNEIDFLIKVLPEGDEQTEVVPITTLLDYHQHGEATWLTLAYLEGGDLYHFIKAYRQDLSLGLMWHIGIEMSKALAYLHFGVADPTNKIFGGSWPLTYHGDFHTGNLLLTSAGQKSSHGYPSLRLADFGRAKHWAKGVETQACFQNKQLSDYKSLAIILEGMLLVSKYGRVCSKGIHCLSNCKQCFRADCEECSRIARLYGRLEGLNADEKTFIDATRKFFNFRGATAVHTSTEALTLLRDFILLATEQRDKHYTPLSDAAQKSLSGNLVPDADIENALCIGSWRSNAN